MINAFKQKTILFDLNKQGCDINSIVSFYFEKTNKTFFYIKFKLFNTYLYSCATVPYGNEDTIAEAITSSIAGIQSELDYFIANIFSPADYKKRLNLFMLGQCFNFIGFDTKNYPYYNHEDMETFPQHLKEKYSNLRYFLHDFDNIDFELLRNNATYFPENISNQIITSTNFVEAA